MTATTHRRKKTAPTPDLPTVDMCPGYTAADVAIAAAVAALEAMPVPNAELGTSLERAECVASKPGRGMSVRDARTAAANVYWTALNSGASGATTAFVARLVLYACNLAEAADRDATGQAASDSLRDSR